MSTITKDQEQAIADYINSHYLPSGIGTKGAACSIAAINIALTNTLTDTVPDCMSAVIGRWIITVQDAVPDAIRNSQAWKSLLPTAAGTGREHEEERLGIIMDWMWRDVLPQVQGVADENGYGQEWLTMCKLKTTRAADAASYTADAAACAARAPGAASYTADAARAAAGAACAARAAACAAAASYTADAAACASYTADAVRVADAHAVRAAAAASYTADAAAGASYTAGAADAAGASYTAGAADAARAAAAAAAAAADAVRVADAVRAGADADADAVRVADAVRAADAAACAAFWGKCDPAKLLAELIQVGVTL